MFTQLNLWVGAGVGAILMLGASTLYMKTIHDPQVRAETRTLIEAQARERAMELIQQASKDHEEISSMDMRSMCIELGGKWVHDKGTCD